MIKLKLKRKISGKRIRESKRKEQFNPIVTETVIDGNGDVIPFSYRRYIRYEGHGIYRKNAPKKRHVENPNVYEGEEPLSCSLKNIRVPSRKRKTAHKRFKKAFPYIIVDKHNKPQLKSVMEQLNHGN